MIHKPDNFKLYEFVCPDVYNKFGQMSWQFFDQKIFDVMDWLRKTIGKPITVNTWHDGGEFTQRGLRCTTCKLVNDASLANRIYVSPHMLGKAFDFDILGMTAEEVRRWLVAHQNDIPHPIRLENNVAWVHVDCEDAGVKIQLFNP